MNDFAVVGAIVRHVLTVVGGGLVSAGYLSQTQSDVLIGSALALAGVLWSLNQKCRAQRALDQAKQI